jgi:hypothetical protein
MITTKYRVEGQVKARYVGKSAVGDHYIWCEQSADDLGVDVAQGTCGAEDLPEDIKVKCETNNGAVYACEWPL